jgi:hypothetical protein
MHMLTFSHYGASCVVKAQFRTKSLSVLSQGGPDQVDAWFTLGRGALQGYRDCLMRLTKDGCATTSYNSRKLDLPQKSSIEPLRAWIY